MGSFATGILCALVLAGGTYWVLEAGTITMVDRSDEGSTVLGEIWEPTNPGSMSVPLATEGNVGN